jgi:hypothetical protein
MRTSVAIVAVAIVLGGSACGATPPPVDPSDGVEDPAPRRVAPSGPAIEAEVGALDEKKVNDAFEAARSEINACLKSANDAMSYKVVGGDIEVEIRVKNDGSVRWSYPTRSTLGHRATERCILDALSKQAWPKPEGGDEGIARTSYGIDAPGRPAVEWSAGDVGEGGAELGGKLRGCARQAGGGGLSVTVYVDPDGKVLSAGAAASDENGIEALECAVDAALGTTFPSPGSYPAKVTLTAH